MEDTGFVGRHGFVFLMLGVKEEEMCADSGERESEREN